MEDGLGDMGSLLGLRKERGRRSRLSSGVVPPRVPEPAIDRLTADRLAGVLSLLYSPTPEEATMRLPRGVTPNPSAGGTLHSFAPGSAFGLPPQGVFAPGVFAPEVPAPEVFEPETCTPDSFSPGVPGIGRHRRPVSHRRSHLKVALRLVGFAARGLAVIGAVGALVAIVIGVLAV